MHLSPSRRVAHLAGALVTVLSVSTALVGVSAATAAPRPVVQLIAAPKVKLLRAAAPSGSRPRALRATSTAGPPTPAGPPLSVWNVNYRGFENFPQARQAFQASVDTWSLLVASSVPIQVTATFKDLQDPSVLGQAGPSDFAVLDRDGNGRPDTAYPLALANALEQRDLSPPTSMSDGSDIDAEFNNNAGKVYYGTDGAVPPGYVDFETVVLHELGHGLGFVGSMTVDSAGRGSFGAGTLYPAVYDRYTVRSGGSVQNRPLLSYPNHSLELGAALTSGAVYWDGPYGKAAYNGRPPRLYAPSPFEAASSYSHLSDVDFPIADVNSLMTPFVEENEVIRDPGPVMLGMFSDMGWGTPQPAGNRFAAIDPVRVLDTRTGLGGQASRLGNGQLLDVSVVGGQTQVPATATAVILNVTGLGPTSATDLRVFPTPRSGSARPFISNLNLSARELRANLVTVPVGDAGRVRIFNAGGALHVLADVEGWYGPQAPSAYEPTDPVRILDTRSGTGSIPAGPVVAGVPLDLTVIGGARAVPADASAVVLTVTALHATLATDVRVFPTPVDPATAPPEVSNLNVMAGQVVPNLVVAKVGAGGAVRLMVSGGSADLAVDLAGWYDQAAGGALFHVLAPQRLLDTRTRPVKTLGPRQTLDLPVSGVSAVPTSARAVVVNVTGVAATRTTDVDAYPTPADGRVPVVSTVNLAPRQTAADLAVVQVGGPDPFGRGTVRLRNAAGNVALVVDIAGWFGNS